MRASAAACALPPATCNNDEAVFDDEDPPVHDPVLIFGCHSPGPRLLTRSIVPICHDAGADLRSVRLPDVDTRALRAIFIYTQHRHQRPSSDAPLCPCALSVRRAFNSQSAHALYRQCPSSVRTSPSPVPLLRLGRCYKVHLHPSLDLV
jgi:hypothetical protein